MNVSHSVVAILTCVACMAGPARAGDMVEYDTPYYVIRTDLPKSEVREIAVRTATMYKEYSRVAKPFMIRLPKKMSVVLYGNVKDFIAAGGAPNMGGFYSGKDKVLVIRARKAWGDYIWHTVQHEGFHQFSDGFSYELPIWVAEGLAEFFGEGVWTGSGLVTGGIPPERLRAIQAMINSKQLLSFQDLTALTHEEWNKTQGASQQRNYNEAWSMAHFFLRANNGQYQDAFQGFVKDMSLGQGVEAKSWQEVFAANFKKSPEAVQAEYAKWWMSLSANCTEDVYTSATVETLTAFLARAYDTGQKFRSVNEFMQAGATGAVRTKEEFLHWLPPELLRDAVRDAAKKRNWSLASDSTGLPALILSEPGGATYTGTFTLSGQDLPTVQVKVDRP